MTVFHLILWIALLWISEKNIPACEKLECRPNIIHEEIYGIHDLQPCDILVKPNHNWLPGTALVNGGMGFGHAAIVIEGATDTNQERLLTKVLLFESHSRDVPPEFQLRKIAGYIKSGDLNTTNESFGIQNKGFRYRLRPDIPEEQKKKIIEFILKQDEDTSSWRALKSMKFEKLENAPTPALKDKNQWYCSLLIWQAFYNVAGIDIDSNGGVIVYPNDLIASKFFENTAGNQSKRVRF